MMSLLNIKKKILGLIGAITNNGKGAFIISYIHHRKRLPNLRHPKDLSEIWIKRVLDGKVNQLSYLADKYAVRKYVEEKGLKAILTPLLAVYENADEINFEILPKHFALKANFGAGYNIICTDKRNLDVESVKNQVRHWLSVSEYSISERHYNLIPKKIICEEFIDDGSGGFPVDYKFMCIHGTVQCILGVNGRENGDGSYMPYSIDWQPIPEYYRGDMKSHELLPKPANLQEMVEIAEKLAEGIDLVRIDLYSNGSRIWFGEITLTPDGCILRRWTRKAIDEMGIIYRTNNKS